MAVQQRSRSPVMRYQGEHMCVRRVVALVLGHNIEGKVATYKCGNSRCVNPEHIVVMTQTTLQRRTNKVNVQYMHPTRRQRVAAARRANAKLSPEAVQKIRDDPRAQREIASDYGITQSTVSRIKRGEMWRDYTNSFIQLFR
jgi:hypothetical protein